MIGERLYDLRRDADMTQDDLAAVLKINKHSISSYERGKSEPPDIIKISIAHFFDVSVDYLLGVSDDPKPFKSNVKYFELPSDFPDKAKDSLRDYADFLAKKYNCQ